MVHILASELNGQAHQKVAQEYPEDASENFQGQWQRCVAQPSACLRPKEDRGTLQTHLLVLLVGIMV